ncbi:hypothetical protein [Stenotrophomonas maltophilia]|uniref:hypothetical protein n=1 Tax=Stenotrophomonas maltophilia TaxID=40324 RepID=UPI0013A610A2|nr:hypothetical protein [Stenotrophomonas maltophilia]
MRDRAGATVEAAVETLQKNNTWKKGDSYTSTKAKCAEDFAMQLIESLENQRIVVNEFPCSKCHLAFLKLSKVKPLAIVVRVTSCAKDEKAFKELHPPKASDGDVLREAFIHYLNGHAYYHSTHQLGVNPSRPYLTATGDAYFGLRTWRDEEHLRENKNFYVPKLPR